MAIRLPLTWLVAVALAGPAGAQNPYAPRGTMPGQNRPGMVTPYGGTQPMGAQTPGISLLDFYRGRAADGSRSGQIVLPGIGGGVPTVRLPGLGLPGAAVPPYLQPGLRTPTKPDQQPKAQEPTWPSWLDVPAAPGHRPTAGSGAAGVTKDLGPNQCFLARLAETVEVRPDGEKSFYPLAFWDQTRILKAGGALRIRGEGRALLVFADGTRIDLIRGGQLSFALGSKETLRLDLEGVTEAHCRLGSRQVEIRLPGGGAVRGSKLALFIERKSRLAPWASAEVEERLIVRNWGPEKLRLDRGRGSFAEGARTGALDLEPDRASMLLLVPGSTREAGEPSSGDTGDSDLPLTLPGGGQAVRASLEAEFEKTGAALVVRSTSGTARGAWGGVRFTVPSGSRLILDPLVGEPFGEGRPTTVESPPAKEPDTGR